MGRFVTVLSTHESVIQNTGEKSKDKFDQYLAIYLFF